MKRVLAAAAASIALLSPGSATADDFQPAPISLDQLFAQTRQAYGTMAPGAYHRFERTVSSDGDVSTVETYRSGDDYKAMQTHDGFTSASGSLGGHVWIQDDNGFVRHVHRGDAAQDPFTVALRHPDDPASGVRLLGLSASHSQYVVEVAPERGLSQLRYYDATTYRLERVATTDFDRHTRVYEYENYSPVGGRFVPHTTLYHDDLSAQRWRSDTTLYEAIDANQLHLEVPESKPLFDLAGRTSVAIPAQFVNGEILVHLSIRGRGLDFMLDSGASSIAIDLGVARELGLTVSGSRRLNQGGDFTIGSTRASDVSIGELHAANVAMQALPHSEQIGDKRIVGLIGCDFFASGALLVNFQSNAVTMLAAPPPDPASEGWEVLPIALDACVPRAQVSFNDKPGSFIIDLGAATTFLYKHYFSQFQAEPARSRSLLARFIGGAPIDVNQYVISRMTFGDSAFADVLVAVPATLQADARGEDGLLGRSFLSNFNLLFDYAHQRLYYKQFQF